MKLWLTFILCNTVLFVAQAQKIVMAGDSTMSSYNDAWRPLSGWGEPLKEHLKDGHPLVNLAVGGYSTKLFIDTHTWAKVLRHVNPDDFVILQFGHNDRKKDFPERYSDPDKAFPENLIRFVKDVRSRRAFPVLVTPTVVCQFSKDGKLKDPDKLSGYIDAIIRVAEKENVPLVDIHKLMEKKFESMTPDQIRKYYVFLKRNEHPNFPDGEKDVYHFKRAGAVLISDLFIEDARKQKLKIASLFNTGE